jgi:hypothetical protein
MKKIDEEWQGSEAFKVINEHRNEIVQLCNDLSLSTRHIAQFLVTSNKLTTYIKKQWLESAKNVLPSNTILEDTIQDIFPGPVVNVDPVQADVIENSKESEDDFEQKSRNPEEPDPAVLDNIKYFFNLECAKKWEGEPHCNKYPDDTYRKKIAFMYRSGARSFVTKTIMGKIQETRVEENLDKFVLESLERSIKENESYYER